MVGSAVLAIAVSSVAIATASRIATSASMCWRPVRPSWTGIGLVAGVAVADDIECEGTVMKR